VACGVRGGGCHALRGGRGERRWGCGQGGGDITGRRRGGVWRAEWAGTQFTCFTGTKVQILTYCWRQRDLSSFFPSSAGCVSPTATAYSASQNPQNPQIPVRREASASLPPLPLESEAALPSLAIATGSDGTEPQRLQSAQRIERVETLGVPSERSLGTHALGVARGRGPGTWPRATREEKGRRKKKREDKSVVTVAVERLQGDTESAGDTDTAGRAASGCSVLDVPEVDLECPISMHVMRDPVLAMDGFTYERESIERWLATSDKSPLTNERVSASCIRI
jgi:hypothetical protein